MLNQIISTLKSYNQYISLSYSIYIDANNVYGLAMSMKLSFGNLQWSNDSQSIDDVIKYEDNDIVYLLEVDLEYPKHVHEYHKDYTLAPEIMNVKESMVS